MGVRRQRACYSSIEVTKFLGNKPNRKGITLYREDTYLQNKSLLYSKMRSIESGRLKLPIPLRSIGLGSHILTVKLDGSLKYGSINYSSFP